MRPVFVTGGTGFVGRHLLAELKRRSVPTIAAARDLALDTDWQDLLDGAGSIVHLAAAAHERAAALERRQDYEVLRRVNALATERLARQAAARGAQHFVFISTIGVCGDETSGAPITEETPPRPRSLYAASKLEAERLLWEVARETGLRVTVLRSTLVYGPGNGGNMLRLLRLIGRGWPLPFGGIVNRRSLTSVTNLVCAITGLLEHPQSEGTFVVCDATPVSTPELVRRLAAGMGRDVRLFVCPEPLLRAAARIAGQHDATRRIIGSLEADCGKLSGFLGRYPAVTPQAALVETGRWFLSEGDGASSG